jgi:tetratricopeptide (TPR) repeat protein
VVGEVVFAAYLFFHPDFFMLEECEGTRPDLASCAVKSVSECPHCHEVVETWWQSCPYCGTRLPRTCGECGSDLGEFMSKCPQCGTEVMQSVSMAKTVEMFQKLTEEKALPETKAIHYARLAEALLKNGQAIEAVEAYRKAISLTSYPRKRTNFMVQAARILANTGYSAEAAKLLDEAMTIDPADIAGAQAVRSEIRKPSAS